jgi:hypothetical protein
MQSRLSFVSAAIRTGGYTARKPSKSWQTPPGVNMSGLVLRASSPDGLLAETETLPLVATSFLVTHDHPGT